MPEDEALRETYRLLGGDRSSGSAGGLPEDAVAVDLPDPGREGRAGGVCGPQADGW